MAGAALERTGPRNPRPGGEYSTEVGYISVNGLLAILYTMNYECLRTLTGPARQFMAVHAAKRDLADGLMPPAAALAVRR